MNELLVIKVKYIIFAILASVNGYIIVMLVPSLKNNEKLERLFRSLKNEANEVSQSIFASRGCVITSRTFQSLLASKLHFKLIRGNEESLMTLLKRSLVTRQLN